MSIYITVIDSLGRSSDLTPKIFKPDELRQGDISLGLDPKFYGVRSFDIHKYTTVSITIDMEKNIQKQLDSCNGFLGLINREMNSINRCIVGLYVFIKNYTISKKAYLKLDLYGSQCELRHLILERYDGRKTKNIFISTRCKRYFDYSKSEVLER